MEEKWLEIVYNTGEHETFRNPSGMSFGKEFLTFKTEDAIIVSVNLNYVIKIGTRGI